MLNMRDVISEEDLWIAILNKIVFDSYDIEETITEKQFLDVVGSAEFDKYMEDFVSECIENEKSNIGGSSAARQVYRATSRYNTGSYR